MRALSTVTDFDYTIYKCDTGAELFYLIYKNRFAWFNSLDLCDLI